MRKRWASLCEEIKGLAKVKLPERLDSLRVARLDTPMRRFRPQRLDTGRSSVGERVTIVSRDGRLFDVRPDSEYRASGQCPGEPTFGKGETPDLVVAKNHLEGRVAAVVLVEYATADFSLAEMGRVVVYKSPY